VILPCFEACQLIWSVLSDISRILLNADTHDTAVGSRPFPVSVAYSDGSIVIVSVGGVDSTAVELIGKIGPGDPSRGPSEMLDGNSEGRPKADLTTGGLADALEGLYAVTLV